MPTGYEQNSKESIRRRRPKPNHPTLVKSLVKWDPERRILRDADAMQRSFADQYPCRVEDQFYDDVTGLCGMCEDICRPQHMDISECQAKCSKYYRERLNGNQQDYLKSSIAGLAAGTTYLLHTRSMSDLPFDSRDTPRMEASAQLPLGSHPASSGGIASGEFVTVIVAMVATLLVILGVTFAVVLVCRRTGTKGCRRSVPETPERNVELALLNVPASSNASNGLPVSKKQEQSLVGNTVIVDKYSEHGNRQHLNSPQAHHSNAPPAYSLEVGAMTQCGREDANRLDLEEHLEEDVVIPHSSLCTEQNPD